MIVRHRDRELLRFDWVEPFGVKNVELNRSALQFLPIDVRRVAEKGDARALKVFVQIGRFLAHTAPWYHEFYDYENLMILGRVTSGLGGEVILETAKTMLHDVYPEWAEKIDIFMPDENARRLGQSVAAAQIPVIRK